MAESSCTTRAHSRRENADVCVAVRRMPIDVVIASAAKQSSFELRASPHDGLLRCARMRKRFAFVAAITVETVCRDRHSPSIVPRTRGPITAGSSFAPRPPTQEPSCPGEATSFASRRRPGHPTLVVAQKAWMAGTSPAMTIPFKRGIRISARCSLEDRPRAPHQFSLPSCPGEAAKLCFAPRHSPIVVPAQAGTHNHRE